MELASAPLGSPDGLKTRFLRAETAGELEAALAAGSVDVNCHDEAGWGILHFVVTRLFQQSVNEAGQWVAEPRTLLSAALNLANTHGLDINHATNAGRTPLHLAATFGYVPNVAEVLAAGAAIDIADNDGYTPLALAAEGGLPATAEVLLKHGADAEVRTRAGDTALTIAACRLSVAVVEVLLDAEAQIDTGDANGGSDGIEAASTTRRGLLARLVGRLLPPPAGMYTGERAAACRRIVHLLIGASARRRRRHALTARYAMVELRAVWQGDTLVLPAALGQ